MEIVAIPLTLIAIVGALFLLAKAQKESLHDVFKYASYLVLTLCIFTLSLVLIKTFDHKKEKKMIKMMHGGNGMHGMEGDENRMMFHHKMEPGGCCPEVKGSCCGEELGKCEDDEKKVIIMDTVIKK